jgi:putative transposase
MLPMGLGYVEGVQHDYVRHGTTTPLTALDIANGQLLTQNNGHFAIRMLPEKTR